MNEQSRTAFNIFTDFYGEPKWMKDPKDGQNPETIIQQWSDELKGYTIDQIRQACAWITRKRRVMTFPTLDVLLCELSDKERDQDSDDLTKRANKAYQDGLLKYPNLPKETHQKIIYDAFGVCVNGYKPSEAA